MLLTAASSGKMWLAEAGECMAAMPRFDCSSEPDFAKLVITELTPKFPDFRVALVVAEGLAIAPHRSATLDSEIAEAEARCRERWSGVELSAIPGVAAWRAVYRAFGIKKTSYRSSVERLIKGCSPATGCRKSMR